MRCALLEAVLIIQLVSNTFVDGLVKHFWQRGDVITVDKQFCQRSKRFAVSNATVPKEMVLFMVGDAFVVCHALAEGKVMHLW